MLKRAIRLSEKVFTVSEFSKERILYHLGTSKEIIVTHNGINHRLKNHKVSTQSPYPFEYILFVGNIKKHKGLSTLLNSFFTTQKNGMNMKLVIVGNSKNFRTKDNEVMKILQQQHDDIIFTGKISDEMLYDIMAYAECLIQPSLYEGFGIPPLEALYLGRPVILSDIPVFREIYGDLPVFFFEAGNSQMLTESLIDILLTAKSVKVPQEKINIKFSYVNSAKIIISTINNQRIQ
jgi:glycosyltransferase involved in cell wall biosynthesis